MQSDGAPGAEGRGSGGGLPPLLEMDRISKAFPGVQALDEVSLTLHAGEVLALLGENGAGKSTLIKILGGAVIPEAGVIRISGRQARFSSPGEALKAGVGIIYQEFNLIPALTARENIFLGRERASAGFIRRAQEEAEVQRLFRRLGISFDPNVVCRELTVAQQQLVEIAKVLSQQVIILVLDEPSATLTPQEVERLFILLRELKQQGLGIIYISHRLDEIFSLADRVMVLRDGRGVGSALIAATGRAQLVEMMVGRKIDQEFPKRRAPIGPPRLVVRHLSRGDKVKDVSFALRRGEVLGLTGLVGAGRTELARLLFGADRPDSGSMELDGSPLHLRNPRDAIRLGICLLTEDRKTQGLILGLGVCENFGLPNLGLWTRWSFVDQRREESAFRRYVEQLRIKISHSGQLARTLSGGNQQKVVLAKWLERRCEVILVDEPTRGIDVGAKYEVYLLLNDLAACGKAILMISSELPEILGMSDRILVMHEGRLTGEIMDVARATPEQIMGMAVR